MSFEHERALDPAPTRKADPGFLLGGYVLGLAAMSPGALLYYWFFMPLGALLAAGVCAAIATMDPRFKDATRGALFAAAFGFVAIVTLMVVGSFG